MLPLSRMPAFLLGLFLTLLSASAWAESEDLQIPSEVNPVEKACQNSIAQRPRTGLLIRNYPRRDQFGVEARPFLEGVIDLAVDRLDKDLTFINNIQKCHSEEFRDAKVCDELREFVSTLLPQLVRDARFHLSLAQSPKALMSGFGQTNTIPNEHLSASGSVRLHRWEKLDKEEFERAKKILKDYQSEIIEHYKKVWNIQTYSGRYEERQIVMASFLQTRLAHYDQYRLMLASAPFLQYFESAHHSTGEILVRLEEFKKNAKSEKTYLLDLRQRLQGETSNSDFDEIVRMTMSYSLFSSYLLEQRPEYCGIFTSIDATQFNRSLGTSLAVGLPLAAASFFMPALVVYPAGLIAGGYFTYEAIDSYQKARRRAGSVLFLDAAGGMDEALSDAYDQATFEVALFPLSFVGGKLAIKGFRSMVTGVVRSVPEMRGALYLPKSIERLYEKFSHPL